MTNEPRVTASSEFKAGHSIPIVQFKNWLLAIPDHATVTVNYYAGDAREPSETTIKATWEMQSPTMDLIRRQMGPHSRSCGPVSHEHGVACSRGCPTCHGGNPDIPAGVGG